MFSFGGINFLYLKKKKKEKLTRSKIEKTQKDEDAQIDLRP
jgi:hypothetical protein